MILRRPHLLYPSVRSCGGSQGIYAGMHMIEIPQLFILGLRPFDPCDIEGLPSDGLDHNIFCGVLQGGKFDHSDVIAGRF